MKTTIMKWSHDSLDSVSIVVPVYNVEKYLNCCVESLRRQSYRNIEIILVDDGSTDSCPCLCDDFVSRDSRISVIHQKNMGLSGARNTGTAAAAGDWIVYVDSDDIVDAHYIEYLLSSARSTDSDTALCSFALCDEKTQLDDLSQTGLEEVNVSVLSRTEALTELLSERRASTSAWAKIAKAPLWKTHPFPVGRTFEDLPTSWKVLADSNRVALLDEKLYYYRKREASITQVASIKAIEDYLKSIDQISEELSSSEVGTELKHSLDFRVCLELCRLIEMSRTVVAGNAHDGKVLIDIIKKTHYELSRRMFSALANSHASFKQRMRIVLARYIPSLMVALNKHNQSKGLDC